MSGDYYNYDVIVVGAGHAGVEAAMAAARTGGDADTTGAIIGGILALAVGREQLPLNWLARREPLDWLHK